MPITDIVLLSVAGVIILTILTLIIIANVELNAFLAPKTFAWRKSHSKPSDPPKPVGEETELRALGRQWQESSPKKEMGIKSFDGLKLHAVFYMQEQKSNKWAICVHGYTGDPESMANYGRNYYEAGYNVVLPDNRAHGKSEGRYIGMGYLDKQDILLWIKEVIKLDSTASIVLHGESMGAATIMMLTGLSLPSNVKCAVTDCGYTSVWDEFVHVRTHGLKMNIYPILPIASLFCKMRIGYFLKEASSIKQLKKSSTPTLFLHGGSDNFVPSSMLIPNYTACAAKEKDWYMFPDAAHCQSQFVNPALYWIKVWGFVNKYIK